MNWGLFWAVLLSGITIAFLITYVGSLQALADTEDDSPEERAMGKMMLLSGALTIIFGALTAGVIWS